jgi:uncharacterized membrane protein
MHYFGIQSSWGWGPEIPALFGLGIVVLILWTLVWKGLALWRAAKRGEKIWFIVFLLVNTLGILEIIYLFFITKAKLSDFSMQSDSKS